MARRLGLLGPIIVLVGIAVAGVGIWYFIHARPQAGDEIDSFDVGDGTKLVVLSERGGGDRSFIELRNGDQIVWDALIPHYAGTHGRPALAWSRDAITIRVERDGRAEVFALAMRDSAKLGGFRLAREHEPIRTQTSGPITLTDHVRSYELVGGDDWHQLIAVDLRTGQGVWKAELGPAAVQAAGIEGSQVWLEQADHRRGFDLLTGREDNVAESVKPLESGQNLR